MITPSMEEDFRMWRRFWPGPETEAYIAALIEELRAH
jgi:hypothetical protein